ncbi:MAG TPA: VOC family protein [Myxococcota bacterium]|nr:VOC family protein [Myxococcota bacterium]
MTRSLLSGVVLRAALLNALLGAGIGAWLYRFAPVVPIAGSAGAIADAYISTFLIALCAWLIVAPAVQHQVTLGWAPARVDPPGSATARFAALPALAKAGVCGLLGLLAFGVPAHLALRVAAPESLSLAGFLGWKAAIAALTGGLVTPAIIWAARSAPPGLVKAVPRFPVLDLAAALDFYQKRLGFQKLFELRDYAGVARGNFELHLFRVDDPNLPLWTACRVNVRGVDALYEELRCAGVVHPNGALSSQPWGFREFTALDLSGNAIVFGERLPLA